MGGGEGKEGDWECGGCENRNYAFRTFCNRCKQPRLLVDSKTPANSKWLPRIGDWICTGCTNNNYASREKCKKCGQPKELAAMPALAMPGTSFQTRPHYFAKIQGLQQHQSFNGALQHPLPLSPNWFLEGPDRFGVQPPSAWPLGPTNAFPFVNQVSQISVPKGWRNGDWICPCGFHNYSSRAECKKCNASMPLAPALGTKRLASEDLVQEWDNKRLNAGQTLGLHQPYPSIGQLSSTSYLTPLLMAGSGANQTAGLYQLYPDGSSTSVQHSQLNLQLPQIIPMPAIPGKGAKQWRDGDWMCTNCDNHNYASRSHCNKCNTQKDGLVLPVNVS